MRKYRVTFLWRHLCAALFNLLASQSWLIDWLLLSIFYLRRPRNVSFMLLAKNRCSLLLLNYHFSSSFEIKMLAKCTRKNGNTPPRVARCGIFSFSPLQPSLFLEKQHAPRSDWREFLPLSCQTCEGFREALFWNSSPVGLSFFLGIIFQKAHVWPREWKLTNVFFVVQFYLWLKFSFLEPFFVGGGEGGLYDFVNKRK